RERCVIGWMPILGEDDVPKARRYAHDRRNHLVAAGHRQRSAGTKIVLHVDDDQNVAGFDAHGLSIPGPPTTRLRRWGGRHSDYARSTSMPRSRSSVTYSGPS